MRIPEEHQDHLAHLNSRGLLLEKVAAVHAALRKDFPLDGGDVFCMEGCTAPYNNGERS